MLPDSVPVHEPPTTGSAAAATDAPSGLVWWVIVGVVALLAVIVGVTELARQPRAPASIQKLAELLVDPPGRTTGLELSNDPATGKRWVFFGNGTGPGEIWTVTRNWESPGTNRGGWLNLTQYETEDQARVGFAAAAEAMRLVSLTPQVVPGHPDAVFEVAEWPLDRSTVQVVTGVGVKGTIVVWGLSSIDTVDWLRQMITDQLGRLP